MPVLLSRAQAAGPWSETSCCAVSGNTCCNGQSGSPCSGTGYCYDRSASSDFLFRLQPGEPERFLPKGGTGYGATVYQTVDPSWWRWGGDGFAEGNDLVMGHDGPPGTDGYCDQGHTYRGSPNAACGGSNNWGHTDLEVWFI